VLLIDEIIHSLDSYLRKFFIEQLIELLSRRRVTLVMVNVNFYDIEHMVNRVILLKDGKIAVDEAIDDLKEKVKMVYQHPPRDIPVLSQSGHPDHPDYFIYPFFEEYRQRIDGEVVNLNLTEIVTAFIGGEYD
jgi:ABC-type multidrug transport system ATPase subunit